MGYYIKDSVCSTRPSVITFSMLCSKSSLRPEKSNRLINQCYADLQLRGWVDGNALEEHQEVLGLLRYVIQVKFKDLY